MAQYYGPANGPANGPAQTTEAEPVRMVNGVSVSVPPETTNRDPSGSPILNAIANTPPFVILLATLAIFLFPVLGAWLNLLPAQVSHVIRNFSEALIKLS